MPSAFFSISTSFSIRYQSAYHTRGAMGGVQIMTPVHILTPLFRGFCFHCFNYTAVYIQEPRLRMEMSESVLPLPHYLSPMVPPPGGATSRRRNPSCGMPG